MTMGRIRPDCTFYCEGDHNTSRGLITLIAKPVETDFEQSLLTIFDYRKATNCAQSLYY